MAQTYWSETAHHVDYSISQPEDDHCSPSVMSYKTKYRNSADIYQVEKSDEQMYSLLEDSLEKDNEFIYEGLIELDKNRFDAMIETDLVSSNC